MRSLAYLLAMYPGVKMYFVAPEVVAMKSDIKEYLDRCGRTCCHASAHCVAYLLPLLVQDVGGAVLQHL